MRTLTEYEKVHDRRKTATVEWHTQNVTKCVLRIQCVLNIKRWIFRIHKYRRTQWGERRWHLPVAVVVVCVCVCESEKRVSVCSEYVWHSWPTLIFLSSGRCVCVCRATEETNVCIILWRLLVMISKYNCAYCSAACLHIHESEHQYSHGSEALRYRLKKGRQRRKTWYAHSNHHHIHTEEGTHSPKCNYAICESTVFGGTENRLIRQINVLDVLECSMRTETWSKILQTQSKQSYTLSRAATGLNFC